MGRAAPAAAGGLYTGHGGTADAVGFSGRGGAHQKAAKPWEVLRDARRGRRPDPWSVEALAAKRQAVEALAAAVVELGLEHRAAVVRRCGVPSVAVAQLVDQHGEVFESFVCGEHGLAVASVDECGHRLCPFCARRASARNRRRILERVGALDETAAKATRGHLVPPVREPGDDDDGRPRVPDPFRAAVAVAQNALGVVVSHTAGLDPDTWEDLARSSSSALSERFALTDASTRELRSHAAAVGVLHRWLRELVPSLVDGVEGVGGLRRRAGQSSMFGDDGVDDVVAVVDRGPRARVVDAVGVDGADAFARDVRDALAPHRLLPVGVVDGIAYSAGDLCSVPAAHAASAAVHARAAAVDDALGVRRNAAAAVDDAARALAAAVARQEAAVALASVEAWPRLRSVRELEAAGAAAVDAFVAVDVEGAALDALAATVHGPVHLHARDRERWALQAMTLRRIVDGRGVAGARRLPTVLAAMSAAWARGRARLVRSVVRGLRAAAVDALRAARGAWARLTRDRRKARRRAAKAKLWRSKDVRFWTLTQKAAPGESARDALGRVTSTLSRFTRSRWWQAHVAGAVVHVEIERSSPSTRRAVARRLLDDAATLDAAGHVVEAEKLRREAFDMRARERRYPRDARSWWHAHVHIAASCGYVEASEASAAWSAAARAHTRWAPSPASFCDASGVVGVVDVVVGARTGATVKIDLRKPKRGVAGVLNEVTKYVTKPLAARGLSVSELAELVDAVRGRQLTRCLGALRGVVLEEGSAPTTKEEGALSADAGAVVGYVDNPHVADWKNEPGMTPELLARCESLWGAQPVYETGEENSQQWQIVRRESTPEAVEFWRLAHQRAASMAKEKRAALRAMTPDGREVGL